LHESQVIDLLGKRVAAAPVIPVLSNALWVYDDESLPLGLRAELGIPLRGRRGHAAPMEVDHERRRLRAVEGRRYVEKVGALAAVDREGALFRPGR
jgi:hypothetical protein